MDAISIEELQGRGMLRRKTQQAVTTSNKDGRNIQAYMTTSKISIGAGSGEAVWPKEVTATTVARIANIQIIVSVILFMCVQQPDV